QWTSIQRCPTTVNENGSAVGTRPVCLIRSPGARGHQRSVSVARVVANARIRRKSAAQAPAAAPRAPVPAVPPGPGSPGAGAASFERSATSPPVPPGRLRGCDSVTGPMPERGSPEALFWKAILVAGVVGLLYLTLHIVLLALVALVLAAAMIPLAD